MTQILLTDLIPVTHGDARLEVSSKRISRGALKGSFRGVVKVEFPKNPTLNYEVMCDYSDGSAHTTDADATAYAIQLRKEIIDQNKVPTMTDRQISIDMERAESNATYRKIRREEDGYRE